MADTNTASTPANGAEKSRPLVIEVTDAITVPVVNKAGAEVGTVSINPAEFGGKISRQLMHDVVVMYLANQRAGTHHTLRRGQVAGSTKKLFRQKGTGNARAGTKRTNKRRGKKRRFKQSMGNLPDWKKAVVTLNKEDKIEFF